MYKISLSKTRNELILNISSLRKKKKERRKTGFGLMLCVFAEIKTDVWAKCHCSNMKRYFILSMPDINKQIFSTTSQIKSGLSDGSNSALWKGSNYPFHFCMSDFFSFKVLSSSCKTLHNTINLSNEDTDSLLQARDDW